MSTKRDIQIITIQPSVKLWGEDFDKIKNIKSYKGKFVVTDNRKLFAKLYPKSKWDNVELFHDMLVSELGVNDPESMNIKEIIVGGGKIEIELINSHIECRLYGKSTVYGDYDPEEIDTKALEIEIKEAFDADDIEVLVVADFEK